MFNKGKKNMEENVQTQPEQDCEATIAASAGKEQYEAVCAERDALMSEIEKAKTEIKSLTEEAARARADYYNLRTRVERDRERDRKLADLEIWRNRTVVEDGAVEDPNAQIAVSEVKAIDPTYEIGDEYADEIKLSSFGRRAVLSLRQNLASRILDLEKASLYEKYSEKVGEIVTGEVYQVWKKEVLILDDEENELILPKAEQIPNDFYRKGDTIKAIVKSVEMNNNQPRIILSRTANQFLERLFEQEVPEIFDGLITIKKIVRIPGERAKVAVESYDERIDPVGACVGMKGSRIYSIVKELRNENIDVVNYTANPSLMIQRALNPAKISSITIDEEKMTASVYLKPDQVSLAIGKEGQNARLAARLTGYKIDIKPASYTGE